MSYLVDTNVLIRSLSPANAQFAVADGAIAKLRTQGITLHLVAQNLYEYWVVATRPVADNGFGLSTQEATEELKRLRTLYMVLADTPAVLDEYRLSVAPEPKGPVLLRIEVWRSPRGSSRRAPLLPSTG